MLICMRRGGTQGSVALFILHMPSCFVLCAWKVRLLTSKLVNCNEVTSQCPHRAQITRASCLKNPGKRNAVSMLVQNVYDTQCNLVLLLLTGGATRDRF